VTSFLRSTLYPNFAAFSLPPLMQTLMMVAFLGALPKEVAKAARKRASPQLHTHMRQCHLRNLVMANGKLFTLFDINQLLSGVFLRLSLSISFTW
jgi:hypothetical protein